MPDLQIINDFIERHADLKVLHIKQQILEELSIIKALELKKEHIISVDIAKLDLDIQCRKKCIQESKGILKEKIKE